MPLKRLAVGIAAAFLFSTLGLATAANAKNFSLTGGGTQAHIGNGLMVPIQAAAGTATTGTMFPNLRVNVVNGNPVLTGTIAKPLIGPTGMGKQGYQRQLHVPAGVLGKPAAKTTVGVRFSNPTVYAVATNLAFKWPAAPSNFSVNNTGPVTVAGFGGTMTYSNALGSRFGGAAVAQISNGDPVGGDLYPTSAVTVFAVGAGTTLPCTHNALGGTDPNCAAGILFAKPTGLGAGGGGATVMTPGAVVVGKNVVVAKIGATPLGTIIVAVKAATNPAIPTNMATSQGGRWTTGRVIIANPAAKGGAETFTLSGNDLRTAGGNGTIQMVSGALSARLASGPNANRGWVRLILGTGLNPSQVPSMSLVGMATTVALILLAFGYTMRRRLFS